MSMAAGEYVSVSSQSDTEQADLARERRELSEDPEFEKEELARIYIDRGVEIRLARKVAQQLMAKEALGALPLILGALSVRIFLEEAALRKGLPGYGDYAARVRHRLIPGVW
jgi:VIT1/CCC1 family predicted Fe2+/Mn2+ transporter